MNYQYGMQPRAYMDALGRVYYDNQNQMQNPATNQQQQIDDRIWVANEQAAEAYPLAPGSFLRLWDSNKNAFYEKRADASGRLFPMERYEYKRAEETEKTEKVDYQKEFEAFNKRLVALEKAVKGNVKSNKNDE